MKRCIYAIIALNCMSVCGVCQIRNHEKRSEILALHNEMQSIEDLAGVGRSSVVLGRSRDIELTKEQRLDLAIVREEIAIYVGERGGVLGNEQKETPAEFVRRNRERLRQILDEKQWKRVEQAKLRSLGASALLSMDVCDKVGITAADRLRFSDLIDDSPINSIEEARTLGEKLYATLSEEQQRRWLEMIGPPILNGAITADDLPEPKPSTLNDNQRIAKRPFIKPRLKFRQPDTIERLESRAIRVELQLSDSQWSVFQEKWKIVLEARAALSESLVNDLKRNEKLTAVQNAHANFANLFSTELRTSQAKRLQEIEFQQQGPSNLLCREFRKTAALTDDQLNRIDAWVRQRESILLSQVGPMPYSSDDARRTAAEFNLETIAKGLEHLDSLQVQVWKHLRGKPIPMAMYVESEAPGKKSN